MSYGFVLTEWRGSTAGGWEKVHKVAEQAGSATELTARLRPWALELVGAGQFDNGQYSAYLVELDEDGGFDTYLAAAVEDLIWFYEQEYVPAT